MNNLSEIPSLLKTIRVKHNEECPGVGGDILDIKISTLNIGAEFIVDIGYKECRIKTDYSIDDLDLDDSVKWENIICKKLKEQYNV